MIYFRSRYDETCVVLSP